MKIHVVSYASEAIDIVTIIDTFISADAQLVIEEIEKFDPKGRTALTQCGIVLCPDVVNCCIHHWFMFVNSFFFSSADHGDKIGTNLFAGLHRVDEMMALLKLGREDNHFMETQNVILIITDGNGFILLN